MNFSFKLSRIFRKTLMLVKLWKWWYAVLKDYIFNKRMLQWDFLIPLLKVESNQGHPRLSFIGTWCIFGLIISVLVKQLFLSGKIECILPVLKFNIFNILKNVEMFFHLQILYCSDNDHWSPRQIWNPIPTEFIIHLYFFLLFNYSFLIKKVKIYLY